ncbi:hypothetical protein LY78DRAFT_424153 [Colletotrichum sublineola]|nr:hypothetical protein LY78DRAFT_424153 [Colletotrichum sublineola]
MHGSRLLTSCTAQVGDSCWGEHGPMACARAIASQTTVSQPPLRKDSLVAPRIADQLASEICTRTCRISQRRVASSS